MIQPVQVILVLFALFALSRAFLRFKDKEIGIKELMLWSLIWIAAIVVVLIPATAAYMAAFFGIGRPVDLVVYLSIIVLFYMIFKVYVRIDNIEKNISKIITEVAIKKVKKK